MPVSASFIAVSPGFAGGTVATFSTFCLSSRALAATPAVILLHHHEVRVALDAGFPQFDVFDVDSGLMQERHRAGIVRYMIERLGSDQPAGMFSRFFSLRAGSD